MELQETVEMMNSNDYKERFKAEYYQLKIRTIKLASFLRKYKNNELDFAPKCSYEFLRMQWQTMINYMMILESRAKIEGIELQIVKSNGMIFYCPEGGAL